MKKPVFIFLISFAFAAACAKQKLEHFIYGKWKSSGTPEIILTFSGKDLMEAEIFGANGDARAWNHKYSIVDEKTVKIFHPGWNEAKVSVYVRARNKDRLTLDCIFKSDSGAVKAMIDQPELCIYREFSRMKE